MIAGVADPPNLVLPGDPALIILGLEANPDWWRGSGRP